MATLKRVTSYMCGECGEKIIGIRHNCPKCKVAFNNVEAQHAKETPLPFNKCMVGGCNEEAVILGFNGMFCLKHG